MQAAAAPAQYPQAWQTEGERRISLAAVAREVCEARRTNEDTSARRCFICGSFALCRHREEGLRWQWQ